MKALPFMNGSSLYVEIRQGSLRVLHGEQTLELALERQESGRLTEVCRERLVVGLRDFLKKKNWQPRFRALCAIGARGVSLRRISLPASPKEELHRLVNLQIESEFPLPPEALAWGYRSVNHPQPASGASGVRQELLVVAVKKEMLEEYAELFSRCGITPQFTLASLARGSLCHQLPTGSALLDIGRKQSELISFQDGAPVSIRILPWGGDTITRSIEQSLGVGPEEAEKLKIKWDDGSATNGELDKTIQAAIGSALDSLAEAISDAWSGQKLYLTGRSSRYREMALQLSNRLDSVQCERLEAIPDHGRSAAIVGLKKASESTDGQSLLLLRLKETRTGEAASRTPSWKSSVRTALLGKEEDAVSRRAAWKWVTLAAVLALSSLCFPYGEAFVLKNRLAKKLSTLKADQVRLATIDRELSFLQYLRNTQPPYIDALSVLANASQPGARIDSLTMNRRGDLSLRSTMRGSQQVTDFRTKLIQSGFFSSVSVDEQTPSPDRQKFTVRISAQWKSAGARERAVIDPSPEEIEKMKKRAQEPQFNMPPEMPPGMMPPGGMPPGFPGGMPPQARPSPSAPRLSPDRKVMKMDMKGLNIRTNVSSESSPSEVIIEVK
jgi:Tfp pilus assembly PilM family ATPase